MKREGDSLNIPLVYADILSFNFPVGPAMRSGERLSLAPPIGSLSGPWLGHHLAY